MPFPSSSRCYPILDYFLLLHQTPKSLLSISQLDGFLLGCACSPQAIMPSKFMPLIWNTDGKPDLSPTWDSAEEAQLFFGALMTVYNASIQALQGEAFSPLATLEDTDSGPQERFHDWAVGALFATTRWTSLQPAVNTLRATLVEELLEIIDLETRNETQKDGVSLPPLHRALDLLQDVYDNHRHVPQLLSQRKSTGSFASLDDPIPTHYRESPKIGRNDPCPCGSGKKYKKCCMN